MKIGFDGKRAVQNFTGLGNYSRYVITNLCRFFPDNEYWLYAPKRRQSRPFDLLLRDCPQLRQVYASGWWSRAGAAWRSWGITRQLDTDRIDIFHGLSNELPLNIRKAGNLKCVVTIHDLIFLRYPQCYAPIDRTIYAYKFRKACEEADAIIAVSECTKRDIIRYFSIPEEKIQVIYQGCSPVFSYPVSEEKKQEVRCKYALPERYILNVGSIEERKNALLLVQAMQEIPQEIHAVLVGRPTPYSQKIADYCREKGLEKRVHLLHGVSFDDLPALYRLAELFVYPSRFEGFGIPIIEALHAGVPVIAATGSCLEEAGGEDSCYIHPDDVEGLAQTACSLLQTPETCERMIRQGKEYVRRFSEKEQACQLMNLYRALMK